MSKPLKITLLVIAVVVVVASLYVILNSGQDQACTMDAKICPNGMSVGRTGPNCEFAPCPANVILDPNFSRLGVITFNNPGQKPDALYLVYEEPGKPALSKELVIYEESICTDSGKQVICKAISTPLATYFSGKRVLVSGSTLGEEAVLVKEIKVISEN